MGYQIINKPSNSTQNLSFPPDESMKFENWGGLYNMLLDARIISSDISVIFITFHISVFNPDIFGSPVNTKIIKEVCFICLMEVLQNTFPNFG